MSNADFENKYKGLKITHALNDIIKRGFEKGLSKKIPTHRRTEFYDVPQTFLDISKYFILNEPEVLERYKKDLVLRPLNTKDELAAWVYLFLGIDLPRGHVYPNSTSSPLDAIWRIYELLKTGESAVVPEVTMLAHRAGYKTLSAAIMETVCMVHLRISIAHMAAIEQQSQKAVQYVTGFFKQLAPYLEANNWKNKTQAKKRIEWETDTGESIYLQVILATMQSTNSEHVPLLCIDELDVIRDPKVIEEAKMIPSPHGDISPLIVNLSTRKSAAGIMEKVVQKTIDGRGELLRWNIIDVMERIPEDVSLKKKEKVLRYIRKELPLKNISPEEYKKLSKDEKEEFEPIEAYKGIAEHPLLQVMKNYLADRDPSEYGRLYKSLRDAYNDFDRVAPQIAIAQLLCEKPTTEGLVYPRFSPEENIISIEKAYEMISGKKLSKNTEVPFEVLIHAILTIGYPVYAGADWGYTDHSSFVFLTIVDEDVFIFDAMNAPKLELSDISEIAYFKNKQYKVDTWYVDQNYAAYVSELRNRGLTVPAFHKDVMAGIAAVQSKIVDAQGKRHLFIVDTKNTKRLQKAFREYAWKTGSNGEPIEGSPYKDREGTSDIMDSLRYPFQNIFNNVGEFAVASAGGSGKKLSRMKNRSLHSVSDFDTITKEAINNSMSEIVKDLIRGPKINTDDDDDEGGGLLIL